MKFSTLATTFVVLMSQASIGQAFVAPSPKNRAPATAANRVRPDGVSPKDKKKGDSGAKLAIAEKHASRRKKWGRDMDEDEEYWARKDIHTLGNMGFFGALHAAMAPISTAMIDKLAYDGVDIRLQVADELASMLHLNQGRILDLCCGVGMSTRALQDAFPNAEQVVGVDTSKEMIAMARAINIQDSVVKPFTDSVRSALKRLDNNLQRQFNSMHHKSTKITEAAQHKAMEITAAASNEIIKACGRHTSFATENAEHTHFESNSFDLITIMYGFHEIPKKGRDTILREARRLLRKGGVLAITDISPDYKPSKEMLAGEPYVQEYQKAIDKQLRKFSGFKEWDKVVVPGHVKMWLLQRS